MTSRRFIVFMLLTVAASSFFGVECVDGYQISKLVKSPKPLLKEWTTNMKIGFQRRIRADPTFLQKSVTEVILAAGTQFAAECNRRSLQRIIPEIDFVIPAVLTAIFGKYYSMWRVAKTVDVDYCGSNNEDGVPTTTSAKTGKEVDNKSENKEILLFGKLAVPTNAFQPYLLDGKTQPTILQRLGSFLAPMVPLFRAGFISSFVGYGCASCLIGIRSFVFPAYDTITVPVNVLYASLYTGCFMAVVSNVRYQLLQGIVEPIIDRILQKLPVLRSVMIFGVRWVNGLIGSMLAISGMRYFGLQRIK